MGLFITLCLGIFILIGACAIRFVKNSHTVEQISIAVAFGTMSALAVLELYPEAVEMFGAHSVVLLACILGGIILLKVLDSLIPEHGHNHAHDGEECCSANVVHIGIVSTIAVILHNTIEGMAVFSMCENELQTGLLIALGVGLHNIPMGMVIYTTLKNEKKNLRWGLLLGASLSTFLGGLLMRLLWVVITEQIIGVLIGITLGMLIYIIVYELLPHMLGYKNRTISVCGALVGAGILFLCQLLE